MSLTIKQNLNVNLTHNQKKPVSLNPAIYVSGTIFFCFENYISRNSLLYFLRVNHLYNCGIVLYHLHTTIMRCTQSFSAAEYFLNKYLYWSPCTTQYPFHKSILISSLIQLLHNFIAVDVL